ncbi:MAG: O-antigen ligase family protein, partial [Phycisphaerales bacterium]|nr:O-antigen ligase family protein [Phycisphaerales bacterium]
MSRSEARLRWSGLFLVLIGAILPASTTISFFPHWDLDPLTFPSSNTGLGPFGLMLCHLAALTGAASLFIAEVLARRPGIPVPCLLGAIGAAATVWHVLFQPDATPQSQYTGLAWLTGIACTLSLVHAGRDPLTRRLTLATLLGFIGLLALRGGQQVYIEHAATLGAYRANPQAFLAAQGWTPGSSMARAYERRLLQPDASGWFGLSNIYTSIAAWATVLGAGLAVAGFIARRDSRSSPRNDTSVVLHSWVAAGAVLAPLAGVAALLLGLSKSGFAAAAFGLAMIAILTWLRRFTEARTARRATLFAAFLGCLALSGPMILIVARGLVGEALGERSLLFRWFYMQAAARIGGANPVAGIGPGNFQDAYLVAKPPLSTEDVASAHNLLMDWWASLGVPGLAWIALLLVVAVRAMLAPLATPQPYRRTREARRLVAAVASLTTIASVLLEHGAITPDAAAVRILGLVLWSLIGMAALEFAHHRFFAIGVAAAAAA